MQHGPGMPECLRVDDAMAAAVIQQALEDRDQESVPFELIRRLASREHPCCRQRLPCIWCFIKSSLECLQESCSNLGFLRRIEIVAEHAA